MEKNYYTGVGSRKTPFKIQEIMSGVAAKLSRSGCILRSGGALGADTAFEIGASFHKEIFRPKDVTEEALIIASTIHPAWHLCSEYVKKLHARNCYQVLGKNLDNPSEFLICWTPDGCIGESTRSIETGGTATAIVLAERNGVRVYNLHRPEHLSRFANWLMAEQGGSK
jgi:hypothetical protein